MSLTAVELDNETLAKLDQAANSRSISREKMLRQAIEQLCEDDAKLAEIVAEGRKAVSRGDFFTQEQIEQENELLRKQIMNLA